MNDKEIDISQMRKGQQALLKNAQKWANGRIIQELSRADLTISALNSIFNELSMFKSESSEWIDVYLSFAPEIRKYLSECASFFDFHPSMDDLQYFSSVADICSFFSHDSIVCHSLFDTQVVIIFGYQSYTASIIELAHKRLDKLTDDYFKEYQLFTALKILKDYMTYINPEHIVDFIQYIDATGLSLDANLVATFQTEYRPFDIAGDNDMPECIKDIDLKGYRATINVKGHIRSVNSSDYKYLTINYGHFNSVSIDNFNFYLNGGKRNVILFYYATQTFVSSLRLFNEKHIVRPTQCRELFEAISIGNNSSVYAESVISFLCKKYSSMIFKDLYRDYLESEGLLLPVSVEDAGKYHTKQELMSDIYSFSVPGNWNKRNINLTYIVAKLRAHMTDEALSRVMQCTKSPELKNVRLVRKNRQQKLLHILYETMYGNDATYESSERLIIDALNDEYATKKISLVSIKRLTRQHNLNIERALEAEAWKKAKHMRISIKSDTKFKKLIENMPPEFELIDSSDRIIKESAMQHNCVGLSEYYVDKINDDKSMIYSSVYNNKRHTIEISRAISGKYAVLQCFSACNQPPESGLRALLSKTLADINAIQC